MSPFGPNADEIDVVARLRSGDDSAFGWLLDTYTRPLRRVARTFVGSDAVADEVVQETWLAVIVGVADFEQRSSLKTWLFGIAVNQARRRAGKERRSVPFAELADEPTIDPDQFLPAGHEWAGHWAAQPSEWARPPAELAESADAIAAVARAIEAVAPPARHVIVLRDVEGLSTLEVAGLLGLSEGNVRVLLHRARGRVRRQLGETFAADHLRRGIAAEDRE